MMRFSPAPEFFRKVFLVGMVFCVPGVLRAGQVDLAGPPGSGLFGSSVVVLPNGNFVVTDPGFDLPDGSADVGAVYLYSSSGQQLSRLTGSSAGDAIGSAGVVIVGNGNFVVRSPNWAYAADAPAAGAVTWGSGTSGVSGPVSADNSLVGNKANDAVGATSTISGATWGGIDVLSTGHYLVRNPVWNNGSAAKAGAVTWGNGNSATTGIVSAANSIVGSTADDWVGMHPPAPLKNGHFLILSPQWNNGAASDAGAVTWCRGDAPTVGSVGPALSLVGGNTNDQLGFVHYEYGNGITALTNGNYVVASQWWKGLGAHTWGNGATGVKGVISASNSVVGVLGQGFSGWMKVVELTNGNYVVTMSAWNGGRGAAMWCNGATGRTGNVSASNSLVGEHTNAGIGYSGVTVLANGNYVVRSGFWGNATLTQAGAVTWGNGSSGSVGVVTSANSLVGTESYRWVGERVVPLSNGNYVVGSPYVAINGLGLAGAATWCDGTTGRSGTITAANSLHGAHADDWTGMNIVALPNGNYVVQSGGGDTGGGAVTWCNGATGRFGPVTAGNSLIGGLSGVQVGNPGITVLPSGNYVVRSSNWTDGSANNMGSVTWCSAAEGLTGTVGPANSLVGSSNLDQIGSVPLVILPNGDYIVRAKDWDNGAVANAGAVTLCSGSGPITGAVSAANSLVGSSANDQVGSDGVVPLAGGGYVVRSPLWDHGNLVDAGAVTRIAAAANLTGPVSAANSLVGGAAGDRVGEGPGLGAANGAYLFSSPKWDNGSLADAGAVMLMPPGSAPAGGLFPAGGVLGTVATRGSGLSFDYQAQRALAIVGRPHANVVSFHGQGQIFSPAEKLAIWAVGQGISPEQAGPDSEPAGDGLPNLIKYAFNLDGSKQDHRVMTVGGNSGLPSFSLAGEPGARVLRLEYLRRLDSGLVYQPLVSITPGSGAPMGGSETITPVDASWERVVRELPVDLEATPRFFGWVEVSLP